MSSHYFDRMIRFSRLLFILVVVTSFLTIAPMAQIFPEPFWARFILLIMVDGFVFLIWLLVDVISPGIMLVWSDFRKNKFMACVLYVMPVSLRIFSIVCYAAFIVFNASFLLQSHKFYARTDQSSQVLTDIHLDDISQSSPADFNEKGKPIYSSVPKIKGKIQQGSHLSASALIQNKWYKVNFAIWAINDEFTCDPTNDSKKICKSNYDIDLGKISKGKTIGLIAKGSECFDGIIQKGARRQYIFEFYVPKEYLKITPNTKE